MRLVHLEGRELNSLVCAPCLSKGKDFEGLKLFDEEFSPDGRVQLLLANKRLAGPSEGLESGTLRRGRAFRVKRAFHDPWPWSLWAARRLGESWQRGECTENLLSVSVPYYSRAFRKSSNIRQSSQLCLPRVSRKIVSLCLCDESRRNSGDMLDKHVAATWRSLSANLVSSDQILVSSRRRLQGCQTWNCFPEPRQRGSQPWSYKHWFSHPFLATPWWWCFDGPGKSARTLSVMCDELLIRSPGIRI
jgi:hypothetical protein